MKITLRLLIALLIVVTLSNTSCQPTDYSADINALKASRDSLAAALKITNANLQTTNNNLAGLSSSVTAIQAQLTVMSGQITTLNTQLTATNATVAGHTTTIATIQSQIKVIQDQIATLNTQQTATMTLATNTAATVVTIQNQLTTVLGQVATLNALQSTTSASLADISTKLTLSMNQLTSLSSQLKDLLSRSIPTNGLVAWYPFNGNANDESGNNHNGTVNGAKLTTDRFGNANSSFNFSGTTNDITLANSQNLVSGSFTVSAWCTIDLLTPYNADAVLIGQFNGEIANDRKWLFGYRSYSSERGISYYLFDNSGNNIFPIAAYTLNWNPQIATWYHITWVFTSGNSMKTYVNGVLNSNVPITLIKYNSTTNNVLTKIGNGKDLGNSAPMPWNGKIDNVGIWNRALSQEEVSLVYGSN